MLIILKVVLQVVTVTLAALTGILDYKWHDKRTKKFKISRTILYLLSGILLVLSIGVTVVDDLENRNREKTLNAELKRVQDQNDKLQADVTRLLLPIKDLSVTFRLDVPLDHPRLAGYRSRLEKCIQQIVSTQQRQCGATIPFVTVGPSEIGEICVPPSAELYPTKGEAEFFVYSILNNVDIRFKAFRSFSKEQFLNEQLSPDLSFSAGETLDSPEHGEEPRVTLCYEIKTKTLFLRGSRVPVDSQRLHSNGQLASIPDLKHATFVIHPSTLLLIYKPDPRGGGGVFTEDTMTAIEISETTSLRTVTLHLANSEDMEMTHTRLAFLSTQDDGIKGRVYVYEPQSKSGPQ